jgi:hypothetical protein
LTGLEKSVLQIKIVSFLTTDSKTGQQYGTVKLPPLVFPDLHDPLVKTVANLSQKDIKTNKSKLVYLNAISTML